MTGGLLLCEVAVLVCMWAPGVHWPERLVDRPLRPVPRLRQSLWRRWNLGLLSLPGHPESSHTNKRSENSHGSHGDSGNTQTVLVLMMTTAQTFKPSTAAVVMATTRPLRCHSRYHSIHLYIYILYIYLYLYILYGYMSRFINKRWFESPYLLSRETIGTWESSVSCCSLHNTKHQKSFLSHTKFQTLNIAQSNINQWIMYWCKIKERHSVNVSMIVFTIMPQNMLNTWWVYRKLQEWCEVWMVDNIKDVFLLLHGPVRVPDPQLEKGWNWGSIMWCCETHRLSLRSSRAPWASVTPEASLSVLTHGPQTTMCTWIALQPHNTQLIDQH